MRACVFVLRVFFPTTSVADIAKSAVLERLRKFFNINKCSVMRSNFESKASNVAAKSGGGRNANGHWNLILGLEEKLYICIKKIIVK